MVENGKVLKGSEWWAGKLKRLNGRVNKKQMAYQLFENQVLCKDTSVYLCMCPFMMGFVTNSAGSMPP